MFKCGLTVTANTSVCPGCGHTIGCNKPNNILTETRPAFESTTQYNLAKIPDISYCSSCGCKIEAGHVFCNNCGSKVR